MAEANHIDGRHEGSTYSKEDPKYDNADTRLDPPASLNTLIAGIRDARSVDEACQIAADEARRLTGFDHVIVYKFKEDSSGAVIAESIGGDFKPCMGLRNPASNIAITKNDRLWGMLMFHHHTGPKYASPDARKACEILAHCLSLEIAAKDAA
jgi:light-regulated signal transduction histidine kinase (bacteriophytochrome)